MVNEARPSRAFICLSSGRVQFASVRVLLLLHLIAVA